MKCIIFDFDGTILDSKTIAQNALNKAIDLLKFNCGHISLFNKPLFYPELLIKVIGEEQKLELHEERLLLSKYREFLSKEESEAHINNVIVQTLLKLRNREVMVSIYSDRRTANLSALVSQYSLDDCFTLICGRDLMQPKPSTQFIDFLSSRYAIRKKDILFIGDTDTDYLVAQRSDIYYAHAKYSNELSNESWKYCDIMIDTPEDLENKINVFLDHGFEHV